jgi:hypothetical protein
VSSAFAPGEANTARNVPSSPLKVTLTSLLSAPSDTFATSRSRTSSSPSVRTGSAPKDSGVCSVVSVAME